MSQTRSPKEAAKIPARTLAYIGDSVFELHMRLHHSLNMDREGRNLQGSMVSTVCAENQARLFDLIFPQCSAEEQALLKNWRNAKLPRKPLSTHRTTYAKSTAFEAWIGFLFLTGENLRLQQFFADLLQGPKTDESDED